MSRITLSRRLTEGTGGWLQYEYQCNRSELFSEKYLSVPIGGIEEASGKFMAFANLLRVG